MDSIQNEKICIGTNVVQSDSKEGASEHEICIEEFLGLSLFQKISCASGGKHSEIRVLLHISFLLPKIDCWKYWVHLSILSHPTAWRSMCALLAVLLRKIRSGSIGNVSMVTEAPAHVECVKFNLDPD